jgi:hypothetical protein
MIKGSLRGSCDVGVGAKTRFVSFVGLAAMLVSKNTPSGEHGVKSL